jgi:2-polyprenyl-3-methyl-5-hydroxy-6-metoxy-1,4-benzoquinol methylase
MKSVRKKNIKNNASLIIQLPEPFNLYRLILDSDHLHFGFWPENFPNLTLEEAQERMFERLFVHFPDPPATVLDVGCGLGLSAYNLSQKGYHVTAISPSEVLINYAQKNYGKGNIDFHVAGFLDNNDSDLMSKKYDVILFQESLQYLNPLDSIFKKARSLLKPKGSVIIGDEICQDKSIKKETAVHLLKDVVTGLFENGFRITVNEQIGKNVHVITLYKNSRKILSE